MIGFDDILQHIEQALRKLEFDCPPQSLYEPINYILSLGGKRIRPVLLLMAYNMYKEDITPALTPAVGIEVFHNFTLLHDDLMDRADKRRGKPTVHKRWNDNAAILSGDAMLIAAYDLIGQTDSKHLKGVLDLFTRTALEICGGQQYDMEFEKRQNVAEEEYLEMIRLKTAVLLACSLKMGALLADAPEDDATHLYQFGINMGLAFQLQDDVLDVYGNMATFGKDIGGDILCDKKTFLLINAFRLANESQLAILNKWIGAADGYEHEKKIKAITSIYNELHLKELSEQKIEVYFKEAMNHLNALCVPGENLSVIKEVSNRLMNRQS